MGNFFKSFGKGVLYLLVLPFMLVILAVYAVVGLFVFIFLGFKSIILFFTGRSLYDDLPEDKKAKEILASLATPRAEATLAAQSSAPNVATESPQNVPQDTSIYNQAEEVDEDPFYVPQYLRNTPEAEVENEDEGEEEKAPENLVNENDISYIHKDEEEEKPPMDDGDSLNI